MGYGFFERHHDVRDLRGTRPPAVAGLFYPAEAGRLRRDVDGYLEDATPEAATGSSGPVPKAVIAPHAGYLYSGPVAGSAFAPWRPLAGRVERVVVIGPSHRVAFRGIALPAADGFSTPLGTLELDLEAAVRLAELPQVVVDPRPHAEEHSLEVELPFLQRVLGDFRLVPLVVGAASGAEVAEVLEQVWGGGGTRIVVSSDLSHFLPWEAARRADSATARAIVELRAELTPEQACGALPINGLLELARRRHLRAEARDLRNSGDIAGDRSRVVGYGAFVFEEPGGADA